MWIDSHCHLNHAGIKEKGTPAELIAKANQNGVEGMLTICCRMSQEIDDLAEIAENHKNVWMSIGTHPHDAGLEAEKSITQQQIVALASKYENAIALGETGLDYYYDNSPRDDQDASFRKHIRAAMESNLPIIIHTRDAEEDTIKIMREEGDGNANFKGVMHCFSGSQWLADQALDMGLYISVSGIATFKKAEELRTVIKSVPTNRLLIETDAPFLAPMPYRGKVNEPAFASETGKFLANFLEMERAALAKITKDNFFTLFEKAKFEKIRPDNTMERV